MKPASGRAGSGSQTFDLLVRIRAVLASGRPLPEGLRSMGEHETDPGLGPVIRALAGELESGQTLSRALERCVPGASSMDLALLRSGEEGDDLEAAIEALLVHHRRSTRLARKLGSATLYPRIVILVAVALLLPILAHGHAEVMSLGGDGWTMASSGKLGVWKAMSQLVGLVLAPFRQGLVIWALMTTAAWFLLFRPPERLRGFVARATQGLYWVGPAMRSSLAATVASSLGLQLRAGIDLPVAVANLIPFSHDPYVRDELAALEERVSRGDRLSAALGNCRVLPRSMAWFVAQGEEGDDLGRSLGVAGHHYLDEATHRLELLPAALEPILILCLGLLVGLVTVGFFAALTASTAVVGDMA